MQFLFIPIWGRLSDRIGRRPVLLWSIAATVGRDGVRGRGAVAAAADRRARVQRHRHREHRGRAGLRRRRDARPNTAPAAWGSSASRSASASSSARSSAASCRGFPCSAVRGPCPRFVAAGLAAVNFLLALRTLPESLPPERRGKSLRRAVPLDIAALRAAVAVPGVGVGGRGQLRDGALVRRHGADVPAVHRRPVRDVERRDRHTSSASSASSARSCRVASSAGWRRASARRAWCTRASSIQAAAFALLGLSSDFGALGRPGALHLGRVDRARQRPDDAVAARVRVAAREPHDPGRDAGRAAVSRRAGARRGPAGRRRAVRRRSIRAPRTWPARSGLAAAGAARRRAATPASGCTRLSAAGRSRAGALTRRRLLRAVHADAVAAAALRLVERLVSRGQERVVIADAALRDSDHAQADGHRDVLAAEAELALLDRLADALCDDAARPTDPSRGTGS